MERKSLLWLTLYFVFLGVITLGVYVGIHIIFKEPFADPLFSSIVPLQSAVQQEATTLTSVAPTLPPDASVSRSSVAVKRVEDYRKLPEYILRGQTLGALIEADGTVRGMIATYGDAKKQPFSFTVSGTKGKYALGIHTLEFGDHPSYIENRTFQEVTNRIPTGTMIQLRISTDNCTPEKRKALIAFMDTLREGQTIQEESIPVPAYGIEILLR